MSFNCCVLSDFVCSSMDSVQDCHIIHYLFWKSLQNYGMITNCVKHSTKVMKNRMIFTIRTNSCSFQSWTNWKKVTWIMKKFEEKAWSSIISLQLQWKGQRFITSRYIASASLQVDFHKLKVQSFEMHTSCVYTIRRSQKIFNCAICVWDSK